MQLSKRRALSTKKLTSSFGWSGAQSFQQHDVQELARILLDAVGQTADPKIVEPFRGQRVDYVHCCKCRHHGRGRRRLKISASSKGQQKHTRGFGSVREARKARRTTSTTAKDATKSRRPGDLTRAASRYSHRALKAVCIRLGAHAAPQAYRSTRRKPDVRRVVLLGMPSESAAHSSDAV